MNGSLVLSISGRNRLRRPVLLPVILSLVFITAAQLAPPAFAQSNVAQADTERTLLKTPQKLLELEKRRREAEQKRGALPTRKVTFADILANPDDIELNLAFAQNQIADGNVQGASATYERILLIQPENARVRLLYAIVLFRLDSLKEAERELKTVGKLKMAAGLRSQIDYYLDQIKLRSKATRYAFMVSAGGQYDWNKNSAPSSGQLLVADLLGTVDDDDLRTHDYAYNGAARLEFTHDLGYQARHRLTGAVSHYRSEQSERKELDLQVYGAEIGLVYDAAPFELLPQVYFQNLDLSNDRYAANIGAKIRGQYQYDRETQIYGVGQFERQKYFATLNVTTAPEKSGRKYTTGVGVNYALGPTMTISAETNHIVKHAQRNFNDYRSQTLSLSHNWLLGKGMFLYTTLTGEITRYGTGDPTVSGLTRHDRLGSVGMTFGIPLNTVINAQVPIPLLRDLFMTVSVSTTRALSNLTNYTYTNRTASFQLSKRWEF